jgi:sulfotransferase 6B1
MLKKAVWTAERFGVTPRKLTARVSSAGLPKVLCVSVPKAGTHLVERAVCLHPRLYRRRLPTLNPLNMGDEGLPGVLASTRPGQVVLAHVPYEDGYAAALEQEDVRVLFAVRDPRDIAVSLAHYIGDREDHPLHPLFAPRDLRGRIELAITGDGDARPPAPSLESILAGFAGWLGSGALVVRFEDLVGGRGGGTAESQERVLGEIYAHLGVEAEPGLRERVFSEASPTFRRGSIGQWRQELDPELEALFEREAGRWMETYGY